MDSIAHYLINRHCENQIERKIIRDNSNPLEIPENTFILYFRLNKNAFQYILNKLEGNVNISRVSSIPNIIKLSAFLRFCADGSYQVGTGNDFNIGMAQPTVSKNLSVMLEFMESHICSEWINPVQTEVAKLKNKTYVYSKFGIPGVIGAVDGTHIRIVKSCRDDHLFINRKEYFSLNAMIICDHDCRILAINARYGGACHDSAVWRLSGFRRYMENLCSNGERSWLLGDSGYPLEPWLVTPFRAPTEPRKVTFNNKHSKARNVVERTIGVLKTRFRCILGERQLHYKPEKAVKIVNACCALHNICLHFKVPFEDLPFTLAENEELSFDEDSINGILVRESIMNSMNL